MIEVKIKYFGKLVEQTQCESESIKINDNDLTYLINVLTNKYSLESMSYKIAVNHQIVETQIDLNDGDFVALLPPFSGG